LAAKQIERGEEEMTYSDKTDRLFVELATDTAKAKEHLDYLIGKRTFFSFAALACCAIAVIGHVVARTESLPGLYIGVFLFAFGFLLCAGMWTTTDAYTKALILFIHSKDSATANKAVEATS